MQQHWLEFKLDTPIPLFVLIITMQGTHPILMMYIRIILSSFIINVNLFAKIKKTLSYIAISNGNSHENLSLCKVSNIQATTCHYQEKENSKDRRD